MWVIEFYLKPSPSLRSISVGSEGLGQFNFFKAFLKSSGNSSYNAMTTADKCNEIHLNV